MTEGETVPPPTTVPETTVPATSQEWITTAYTEPDPDVTTYPVTESATEPDTEPATEPDTEPGTVSDTSDLIPVGTDTNDGTSESTNGDGTDTAETQDPEGTDGETSDTAEKSGRNTALIIASVAGAIVLIAALAVIIFKVSNRKK